MRVQIKDINSENFADLCDLFNTSRECQLCYCMSHRREPKEELQGVAAANELQSLVGAGKVFGLLAYEGEKCVGWCGFDPLESQPGHDYNFWKHAEKGASIWSIHCLYVRPEQRNTKLSTRLIEAATKRAQELGAKKLLAFPIPEGKRHHFPEHDGEFSGRLSTYKKLGYKTGPKINDFYQVMELTF